MKLKTIYYLNGTHWDREWYRTFQEFRFRLVDILDELLTKWEDMGYTFGTLDELSA